MTIGRAIRQAAIDFYFNSWRFVPANVIWAVGLLAVLFAGGVFPPALVLGVLLAAPVAGMHRMAALLARGEAASFGDFVDGIRRFGLPAAGIAAGAAVVAAVLTTNVLVGFGSGGPLGWFLGATALYGGIALAMFLVAVWPILVDPKHESAPLRRRIQVAALVVIGRPGRLFLLTALIIALLAISVVLLAAIVLVAVGYTSLLAARWVLPVADELESRYEAARAR
jgi:uncharacterized membrane protein YesL